MKCDRIECSKEATSLLGFEVPATGVPFDAHQPATFFTSIKLCPACLKASKFSDIAVPETKAALRAAFGAAGRAAPDFDRARPVGRPLDDKTLEALEADASRRH